MPRDRVTELRRVRAGDLEEHPSNWRGHPETQRAALRGILDEVGWASALVAYQHNDGLRLIDGHLRAGIDPDEEVPVLVLDVDDAEAEKLLLSLDPISAMARADGDKLRALVDSVRVSDSGLAGMLRDLSRQATRPNGESAEAPMPPVDPKTQVGDLYQLGQHRLLCGDATSEDAVGRLTGDDVPDLVLTDPPYCSGGFQESGRSAGSVGTDAPHKQIANDRLSTRGYQALLRSALGFVAAPFVYVFTDWRMWVYLFDVVESSGFGVRSMIVWDKGSPGMGRGWRSQHELVMWGTKTTPPFDKHAPGIGNVIAAERTGNEFHTTEKPVPLLARLLEAVPFAVRIYDPFIGSGSTLVASEQEGRTCLGMELDPAYCDVAVSRWERYTGQTAELVNP